jgi:nitronate monooxygenase
LGPLRLPVIVAPMFLVSSVEMVVAACNAGVVASLPAANARTPARLADWLDAIDRARTANAVPVAVNLNVAPGRYAALGDMVAVCRDRNVPLVISSVGDPNELVRAVHGWGGLVFHDVVSLRHARKAAAAGVDGLILVCAGAGGHSGALSPFAFLRAVRRFFDGIIVLAGGIADGQGIAAARMLGADLVAMGTRFIATVEAGADADYKRMIVGTDVGEIVYTSAISGLPANFMRPSIIANGVDLDALDTLALRTRPALPDGVRAWKHIWSAGHAVGTIDDIPTVADLVARLETEYLHARDAP